MREKGLSLKIEPPFSPMERTFSDRGVLGENATGEVPKKRPCGKTDQNVQQKT